MKTILYFILLVLLNSCSETTGTNDEKITDIDAVELRTYTIDTLAAYSDLFDTSWEKVYDLVITDKNLVILESAPQDLYQFNRSVPRKLLMDNREQVFMSNGIHIIELKDSVFYIGADGFPFISKFYPDSEKNLFITELEKIHLTSPDSIQSGYSAYTFYDNHIFAVMYNSNDIMDTTVTSLNKYDFEGNLIERFPYNRNTYWISIFDDIVYGNSCLHCNDSTFVLTRYDLKTKQFLRDISHPSQFGYGNFIFEDKFYFVDTENRFVGFVPLTELLD